MDNYKKMVIIKGEPQDDVVICYYDKSTKKRNVTFSNGKTYYYWYDNIKWLENPEVIDKDNFKFSNNAGIVLFNIKKILAFKDDGYKYLRFFFEDGTFRSYNSNDLYIEENALVSSEAKSLLEYYKLVSEKTGLKADDGTNTLKSKYENLSFVGENTVLAKYLSPSNQKHKYNENKTIIFPFGCNLSQVTAVKEALTNQISIIEGPPGTGKTQTILNIIANIVLHGKTVAVISNNNSATQNVYEKLQKYGFDYITAELGSSKNKTEFIDNKQLKYPDFSIDLLNNEEKNILINDINNIKSEIEQMLENKNKISLLKQDLSALETEKQYFDEYFTTTYEDKRIFKTNAKLTSEKVLTLWTQCNLIAEQGKNISFWFKLKTKLFYGVNSFNFFNEPLINLIPHFQKLFYTLKKAELESNINNLEKILSVYDFDNKMKELSEKSTKIFKAALADKYRMKQRKEFTSEDLWKNSNEFLLEYPVILSTTYSATSSLNKIIYDYIIVDEASQVDLTTGVLAMSCAKNIVIVGDLKQLPNVINNEVKTDIVNISDKSNIPSKYIHEENSLLSSVCSVFDSAPRTLLREHYRCHPKIINFCNQKFYNNQLIIMTNDNNEEDVLKAYITSKGNHARGHYNQRQIDVIRLNIIPELNSNDLGIITPYKDQTSALVQQIQEELPISTVHKFQGRENDDIIISTVDNEISDFTDSPNMLNVAVSRAKNRLRIVVSDNEKNENTNIGDLVKYIEYNNFEIKKSDIFSVFDMLYKSFEENRKVYLSQHKKISEYDSENLMHSLIEDVLMADEFSKLSFVSHQPLNSIIRNPHKLNDEEVNYAMNSWTHVDFLIYNCIDKSPFLAVEVDGYKFHKTDTVQHNRDKLKDQILQKYQIPIIRFKTNESMEKQKLQDKLKELILA